MEGSNTTESQRPRREAGTTADADLEAILQAAAAAVDPTRLAAESLADEPLLVRWGAESAAAPPLTPADRTSPGARPPQTVLISLGSGALEMARGAVQVLGGFLDRGVVATAEPAPDRPAWLPAAIRLSPAEEAGSPEVAAETARQVLAILDGLGPRDRVVALVGAGASSLLCHPAEPLTVEDVMAAMDTLRRSGASPEAVGRLRAVLDSAAAGGVVRAAGGAELLLIFTPGGGAERPDPADAALFEPREVAARGVQIELRRARLWDRMPAAVQTVVQTRSRAQPVLPVDAGEASSPRLTVRVLTAGVSPLDAASAEARILGYGVQVLSRSLLGDARRAGRGMARAAVAVLDGVTGDQLPVCLLASGETRAGGRRDLTDGTGTNGAGAHAPGPDQGGEERARAARQGAAELLRGRSGVRFAALAGASGAGGVAGSDLLVALVAER